MDTSATSALIILSVMGGILAGHLATVGADASARQLWPRAAAIGAVALAIAAIAIFS